MPDRELRWANVERLVVGWLKSRTSLYVCTELPEDLEERAAATGVVRVSRAGGGDGEVLDKDVAVELEAYAADRPQLWDDVVAPLEQAMADLPADGTDDGYVDDVDNAFAFAGEPHPNPSLRYATGTFTLTVRPL